MNQNKLFVLARWRLAGLYAGVMGVILGVSGLSVYHMMAHAHLASLDQELESVAGTLHDSLEPVLKKPGRMELSVKQFLPGLCLVNERCLGQFEVPERHILGAAQRDGYYVRFLDQMGSLIATVGEQTPGLPLHLQSGTNLSWQTLQDSKGERFHQVSLLLKSRDRLPWGYMQVGKSLKKSDDHLASLKLALLVGLPVAMLVIIAASWWLSGLAMNPVYQSYQQIQQFTADAAHELRTPLAATRATVESVLEMDVLTETEARSTLKTVERQNSRLSQLVQDLLLLSRMDLQVRTSKQQLCCLNDLISDVIEELEALAIAADLQLIADIRIKRPIFVAGDEEQLYRLVVNLVTNAIQYTPAGGKVTLLLDYDDRYAQIQVRDTGIGIAPEAQSRIFDRFYRVSSDRSRETGGSGLGLAIARSIAKAHSGSITVKSELEKGSVFIIQLPLETKGVS